MSSHTRPHPPLPVGSGTLPAAALPLSEAPEPEQTEASRGRATPSSPPPPATPPPRSPPRPGSVPLRPPLSRVGGSVGSPPPPPPTVSYLPPWTLKPVLDSPLRTPGSLLPLPIPPGLSDSRNRCMEPRTLTFISLLRPQIPYLPTSNICFPSPIPRPPPRRHQLPPRDSLLFHDRDLSQLGTQLSREYTFKGETTRLSEHPPLLISLLYEACDFITFSNTLSLSAIGSNMSL